MRRENEKIIGANTDRRERTVYIYKALVETRAGRMTAEGLNAGSGDEYRDFGAAWQYPHVSDEGQ